MKSNLRERALAAMLTFAAVRGALAQDRTIALGIGTESRLLLDKPFQTVIVGDPLIVDIRTHDDRSVVIEPLKTGVTNLVFVDARGMVTANITVSVCEPSSPGCATRRSS